MFKKSNYEERKISSLHMGGMLAIITTYFMIFFFLLLNQTRQFPKLNVTEFKVCFRDISISRTSLTFCVFIFFQRDRIKFFFYSIARTYTLRHYKRCIFQLIRDALAKDYP